MSLNTKPVERELLMNTISIKQSLMGATDKDMAGILKVSRPDYSRFKNGIVQNKLKPDKAYTDIVKNIENLNTFFTIWREEKLKYTNGLIGDIKKYQESLMAIEV